MSEEPMHADAPWPLHGRRFVVAANVALAVGYAASGAFGLTFFARSHPEVTLIWLPSGLALAALILWGPRVLPGIFAGAALIWLALGAGAEATVIGALGNTAEAALASALLAKVGFSPGLGRPRDLLALVGVGALVPSVVGATVTVLALDGVVSSQVWVDGWLGHAGGVVILTPLLLLGAGGTPSWGTLARRGESWVLVALVLGSEFVVFGGGVPSMTVRLVAALLTYLVVVWAGLRLGLRGAVASASLIAALAIAGRARGSGPFGEQGHLLLLWVYLLTLSVTAIALATTVAARETSERGRRAADREVRELEDQVRHAQRLEGIGLLAGGIAHDFNNLLLVIQANAGLLDPDERQKDYVLEIETATRQAADLCRQLLTYAGRGSPKVTSVDLCALVDEMRAVLRTRIPQNIRIDAHHLASTRVRADATQVRQAVMNLVLNASEAIGVRGGNLRLTTGTMDCRAPYLRQTFLHSDAEPGPFVFVDVEDDGCGMDADTLRRMFDPFFTTKATGRGLGLMTVAGVARSHGGAIKVTSAPGQGTRFRLLLPPWEGAEPSTSEEASARPARRPTGETILVADDEPAVLRAAERILRKSGYVVLTARDGIEAVKVYQANHGRVDAVLIDVSMPGLTGPRAIADIRASTGATVPVVLMSGHLPDGTLPEVAGFRVLAKPFGVDALLEALNAAVGRGPPS